MVSILDSHTVIPGSNPAVKIFSIQDSFITHLSGDGIVLYKKNTQLNKFS